MGTSPQPEPQPPAEGSHGGPPPTIAVWVTALAGPVTVLASVPTFGNNQQTTAGSIGLTLFVGGALLTLACFAIAAPLVVTWLYRARITSDGRNRSPHRLSARWAAAGWFIPVGNLWLPAIAIVDLCRATDPGRAATGAHRCAIEVRIWLWWIAWLGSGFAFWFGWTLLRAGNRAGLAGYTVFLVLAILLLISAGALFTSILRRISRWLDPPAEQPSNPQDNAPQSTPDSPVIEPSPQQAESSPDPEPSSPPLPAMDHDRPSGDSSEPRIWPSLVVVGSIMTLVVVGTLIPSPDVPPDSEPSTTWVDEPKATWVDEPKATWVAEAGADVRGWPGVTYRGTRSGDGGFPDGSQFAAVVDRQGNYLETGTTPSGATYRYAVINDVELFNGSPEWYTEQGGTASGWGDRWFRAPLFSLQPSHSFFSPEELGGKFEAHATYTYDGSFDHSAEVIDGVKVRTFRRWGLDEKITVTEDEPHRLVAVLLSLMSLNPGVDSPLRVAPATPSELASLHDLTPITMSAPDYHESLSAAIREGGRIGVAPPPQPR